MKQNLITRRPSPQHPLCVLFVCLGNICRSPAAHAVMQQMVDQAGLADVIRIDSAGIGDWHEGQLPDHRMRRHGQRRGYNLAHRARQIRVADFDRQDIIVVMDEGNWRDVSALARSEADMSRVVRMSDYLPDGCGHHAVPDPYYGSDADFELALDLIEQGCHNLLDDIQHNL